MFRSCRGIFATESIDMKLNYDYRLVDQQGNVVHYFGYNPTVSHMIETMNIYKSILCYRGTLKVMRIDVLGEDIEVCLTA